MEKRETASSHDAIPIRDADPPYTGSAGQTRFENVHLVRGDGSLASVSVCRAVNTQTHPELRKRALAGLLHRFEDGRELALSFVYHDPEARKFALVLPAVLAHTELREWSRLMGEIAEDTAHAVPAYVRDNTTVIGLAALARYALGDAAALEPEGPVLDAEDSAADVEREHWLTQRERELAEQERALIRMAEGLTAREGELNRMQEQLDTARVDLELREQEADRPSQRPRAYTPRGVAAVSGADAFGLRTHPPPLPNRHRSGPPPLPHRPRAVPPPLGGHREPDEHAPPPLPNHPALVSVVSNDKDPEPEVSPPAYFEGLRPGQMAVKLEADELWLFAHIDEEHAASFRRGVDLLLQYSEVEGYPVLLLSLLAQSGEVPPVRTALDGQSEADLRVLEHLSRSFRARIAVYIGGVYCETLTVATLREAVAQAISDKLAQRPAAKLSLSAAEAMLRVMHAPPPHTNDDLPFGPARREASTTSTVLASVEQLDAWLRPEKLAEATLTYCVPSNVIDATIRRVLRAAVAFGIALPDALVELAVEHRAARDSASLVRAQLQAFRHRVEHSENDLGITATRRNWDLLFEQAAKYQVEIDDVTRALANSTQSSKPKPRPDATRLVRPFEALVPAELRAKLKADEGRKEAIQELSRRGDIASLEPVLAALEALPARDVPGCVAHVLLFGQAAGQGLIHALQSGNPALRQIAALALGRLKLRRALAPLVQQLEDEDSEVHPELARALGDFGTAAVRALAQAIPDAKHLDRLINALAHVANHGAARDVEKLENDSDSAVAHAARKAMARRSRMEWEDLAVREQRNLGDSEPAAQLSQAFYAELAKVAI